MKFYMVFSFLNSNEKQGEISFCLTWSVLLGAKQTQKAQFLFHFTQPPALSIIFHPKTTAEPLDLKQNLRCYLFKTAK